MGEELVSKMAALDSTRKQYKESLDSKRSEFNNLKK